MRWVGDQEQVGEVGEGGPKSRWVRGDPRAVGEGDQEQVGEGGPRAGG